MSHLPCKICLKKRGSMRDTSCRAGYIQACADTISIAHLESIKNTKGIING